MCLRPSYTAIVCPTMAGTTVDARDQVLITRFSRVEFMRSIFSSRCSAMKAPFFADRVIYLFAPPLHDEFVGALVPSRLLTHGHLAPWCGGRTARGGTRLAATVRVIDRVHRDAAH